MILRLSEGKSADFMNVHKQMSKHRSEKPREKNYNFMSKIIDIYAIFV